MQLTRSKKISLLGTLANQMESELYSQLRAGEDEDILIEVANHLDSHTIRGIALTPTAGLARGSTVTNTAKQLQVPVGERTLGRVFNVFGNTIDGKEEITGGEWRSIHQPPLALKQRSTTSEILETGIKAIDTFGHLSASIVLSRKRASEGLYPAVDPLKSGSKMLSPTVVGKRHYQIAQEIKSTLASYEDLKDIIAMLGKEELSERERATVDRARRLERFLTQPFFSEESRETTS